MSDHIIRQQYIDVTTEHVLDGFAFKEQLSEVFRRKLLPALEKLFDAKAPDHKIIRTRKLVIDAGEIPAQNWEAFLIDRVIEEMTKQISGAVPLSSAKGIDDADEESELFQEISEETNVTRSILYFLEYGVLPWFSFIKSKDELQHWMTRLLDDKKFLQSIMKLIKMNSNAADRLIYQFDEVVSESIVIKGGIEKKFIEALWRFWKPVLDQMKVDNTRQKKIIYNALLVVEKWEELDQVDPINSTSKNILRQFSSDEMQDLILLMQDEILTGEEASFRGAKSISILELAKNEKVKEEQRIAKKTESVKETSYITNAGLVILHPFLAALFTNVGYTENDKWISKEVQHRAITLMQYLVNGMEEYPEFDLMLNKILTGFPLDRTLPADIVLSDFEKSEAMDLLNSVIKHWTALKNSSVEGLQSTFLMREGKLSMGETGWILQVEQKTVDILISRLPWGISIVKTPWMEKMMHVEWA